MGTTISESDEETPIECDIMGQGNSMCRFEIFKIGQLFLENNIIQSLFSN